MAVIFFQFVNAYAIADTEIAVAASTKKCFRNSSIKRLTKMNVNAKFKHKHILIIVAVEHVLFVKQRYAGSGFVKTVKRNTKVKLPNIIMGILFLFVILSFLNSFNFIEIHSFL